jgi:two-component system, LuxR family, sensor kinase FixL
MGTSTTLVGAVTALYILVLLIVGTSLRPATIIGWSIACALLAVTSFLLNNVLSKPDYGAMVRVAASLASNAVTTILLLRIQAGNSGLRASEHRYRTIFDTLSLAIWEQDFTEVEAAIHALREQGVDDLRQYIVDHPDFVAATRRMVRIIDVNETAVRMMGVASKSTFFHDLSGFLPESDESFADCLIAIDERHEAFQAETTVYSSTGDAIDVIVTFSLSRTGSLSRVPACILDISERKRLETTVTRARLELERAQRTEMLGAVTATIAHEINQPLAAIQSFADAASRWINRKSPDFGQINEALSGLSEAAERARQVVKRTRSLVGNSKAETAPVDLSGLLAESAALMRQEFAVHQARVQVDAPEDAVHVLGDRILLQQVLVNLTTNALQAMDAVPPERRSVRLVLELQEEHASFRVIDTGPGWADDMDENGFAPFTTTKRDGMGLGLAICRSIVEAHTGTMRLRHADGGGAEVEVVLPAHTRRPADV